MYTSTYNYKIPVFFKFFKIISLNNFSFLKSKPISDACQSVRFLDENLFTVTIVTEWDKPNLRLKYFVIVAMSRIKLLPQM